MGKSSLFNSLFGMEIVKEGAGPEPITCTAIVKEYNVHGITVKLVDTPGFGALLGKPRSTDEIMADIADELPGRGEEVDVLIYCLSMKLRLSETDGEIALKITESFQEKLWANTVFALTFANQVEMSRIESATPKKELALAAHFNTLLAEYTDSIHTNLLKTHCKLPHKLADAVPVLPAGYVKELKVEETTTGNSDEHHKQCILPDGSNWLSNFWYQTFLRIRNPDSRYAFYRATFNIHPFLRANEHRTLEQQSL